MNFKLRDYQQAASDAAIKFFNDGEDDNGLLVLPTGSGKSIIISDIAHRLDANVLVFCPSKEITQQNYSKMKQYTDDCSMYSASVGMKEISKVTFATIGSVKNKTELFEEFDYIMVDEAHYVNGEKGMYLDFMTSIGRRVLGLTATPFRLFSERYFDKEVKQMRTRNSMLVMLTNDENKFFNRIIYSVQISDLLNRGYLSQLKYYNCKPRGWNENKIFRNTSGSEFSEKSVRWMMDNTDHIGHLTNICYRLLFPKSGIPRNGIIVFVQFVEDAEKLTNSINQMYGDMVCAYISGETTKANRERILEEFSNGSLKIVANVGCLTTGLDIPKLDTIVLGRPTLSLALYYQMIGRAIRPYEGKDAWVIDTVGNYFRFGEVGNLELRYDKDFEEYEMYGYAFDYEEKRFTKKQLTGIYIN